MLYRSVEELIGKTPLVELSKLKSKLGLKANIYAKTELFNLTGSVKDRAAKFMLDAAERDGNLNKDTVIIEPTSGNTGIGLSALAAVRGYRIIIVMPETMSIERRLLMSSYGAELVLTDGSKGMKGAIEKAEELASQYENSFIPGQFDNKANAEAHFATTGPEIYEDLGGNVDMFIAGVGTGGTITGTGKYLKSKKSDVKVIAVEPYDSPVLSEGRAGAHKIQGIGAGFVPSVLDTSVYDEIKTVTTEEAFDAARKLAKSEGILSGISSGGALSAAISYAMKDENEGKNIVVLLPDTGERYLSTPLYREDQ